MHKVEVVSGWIEIGCHPLSCKVPYAVVSDCEEGDGVTFLDFLAESAPSELAWSKQGMSVWVIGNIHDKEAAMIIHKLKLSADYYDDSASGVKTEKERQKFQGWRHSRIA